MPRAGVRQAQGQLQRRLLLRLHFATAFPHHPILPHGTVSWGHLSASTVHAVNRMLQFLPRQSERVSWAAPPDYS